MCTPCERQLHRRRRPAQAAATTRRALGSRFTPAASVFSASSSVSDQMWGVGVCTRAGWVVRGGKSGHGACVHRQRRRRCPLPSSQAARHRRCPACCPGLEPPPPTHPPTHHDGDVEVAVQATHPQALRSGRNGVGGGCRAVCELRCRRWPGPPSHPPAGSRPTAQPPHRQGGQALARPVVLPRGVAVEVGGVDPVRAWAGRGRAGAGGSAGWGPGCEARRAQRRLRPRPIPRGGLEALPPPGATLPSSARHARAHRWRSPGRRRGPWPPWRRTPAGLPPSGRRGWPPGPARARLCSALEGAR